MQYFQRRMEQLKFLYYCLSKSNDTRFMKRVRYMEKENDMVSLENFGGSTKDILYFIDMKEMETGFFAIYNRTLTLLYFADKYGLKSVIKYDKSFPYAELHPVNGTDNPFEYYFKQPCDISLEDMKNYGCVLVSRKENGYVANALNENSNGYSRSELFLEEMGRIVSKYIRLNDEVNECILKDMSPLLGTATLGVHVRGTDFKRNYNGHPICIKIEDYLHQAITLFQTGKYQQIFLATDDLDAFHLFKKQFGNKLFSYEDVVRSNGNTTVMYSENRRKNHHYLLGLEVLRDMYSLAACDGLIAGLSQVSYAARIQKNSLEQKYIDLIILNKGINYHKRNNCPT